MGRQGHLQCTEPGRLRKDRAGSSEGGKEQKKGLQIQKHVEQLCNLVGSS